MDRPKILLAGEPVTNLAVRPSILSLFAPEFLLARDAPEAFIRIATDRPRLAILSALLPGFGAGSLTSLLRADRSLKRTAIIVVGREDPSANICFADLDQFDWDELIDAAERLLCVSPRVKARAPVCLGRLKEGRQVGTFAMTVDLSESGVLLESRERLSVGEEVLLRILLPKREELISTKGRVIRSASEHRFSASLRKGNGFGLQFSGLLPGDRLRIRSAVAC